MYYRQLALATVWNALPTTRERCTLAYRLTRSRGVVHSVSPLCCLWPCDARSASVLYVRSPSRHVEHEFLLAVLSASTRVRRCSRGNRRAASPRLASARPRTRHSRLGSARAVLYIRTCVAYYMHDVYTRCIK